MKNLQDLMTLISEQIKKNEGRMVQYIFSINTEYMWVSFKVIGMTGIGEKQTFLDNFSVRDANLLQQAYWTIYNNSRNDSIK